MKKLWECCWLQLDCLIRYDKTVDYLVYTVVQILIC